MTQLIGEFDCKLDTKGRLMVPASLKKQLPNIEAEGLVLCRGFEKNLILYPKSVWDSVSADLIKLNMYEKDNRDFVRRLTRGATPLSLDATGRVLLPKALMDWAGVASEVVLSCQLDKIELWDKAAYDSLFDDDSEDFASLAQRVMGDKKGGLDG